MRDLHDTHIFLSETAPVNHEMKHFDFIVAEGDVCFNFAMNSIQLLPTTSRVLSFYLLYLRRKQASILA
jgi:hypothetical protein